jgi:hypothetical protein
MPRADSGVLPRSTLITRALAVLLLLTFAPPAHAEGPIARSARAYAATRVPELSRPSLQWAQGNGRRRGPGRIIAGAAVGATAGFFGGGYLGAAIDGDCGGCDDPGLKGALIGAPIGAVAGGILGGKFLF